METEGKGSPDNCPACGSDNIEYGDIDSANCGVVQRVRCEDCDQEWSEFFEHSHWKIINK